jgi:hypothetical protein
VEKVTLKVKQGILSVEDIIIDSDSEHVYVLFAVFNTNAEVEWSVGFAAADNMDRVYISVTDKIIQEAVLTEALPLLLNALEIKTIHSDSPEELTSYKNAIKRKLEQKDE